MSFHAKNILTYFFQIYKYFFEFRQISKTFSKMAILFSIIFPDYELI